MPSRRDLSPDLPVDFSPLAREEFLHEVRYYAAHGQALRFIAAVVEALDRVQASASFHCPASVAQSSALVASAISSFAGWL